MEHLRTEDAVYEQLKRSLARAALSCLLAARGRPPLEPLGIQRGFGDRFDGAALATTPNAKAAESARLVQRAYRRHARISSQKTPILVNLGGALERCALVGPVCALLGKLAHEQLRDAALARRLLRKGALLGDAAAQRSLGILIYAGRGQQDAAGSVATAAPDLGDLGASSFDTSASGATPAGSSARDGIALRSASARHRDYARARHLFSNAAAQGDAIALNNLAVMCAHGLGGAVDYGLSCECLLRAQQAASAPLPIGTPFGLLRNVALMLYHGGVEAALTATSPQHKARGRRAIDASDLVRARRLFTRASRQGGDAISELYLGAMHELGEGGPRDPVQARAWYVLAAQHDASTDPPEAGSLLFELTAPDFTVQRVRGVPFSPAEALCLALHAPSAIGDAGMARSGEAEESDAEATPGRDGNGKNGGEAAMRGGDGGGGGSPCHGADTWQKLADGSSAYSEARALGDAVLEARARLGRMCYEGQGGPRNAMEARKWLHRAAVREHPGACLSLGAMCQLGEGGPVEPERARQLYEVGAHRGLVAAQTNLAAMHRDGEGGDVDRETARRYYQVAADAGDSVAMMALATLSIEDLQNGVYEAAPTVAPAPSPASAGVVRFAAAPSPASPAPASAASRPAMQKGARSAKAAANQAVDLLIKVAERGEVVAQLNLGLLFEAGDCGVPRDLDKAKKWFGVAAVQGDPEALVHLANILLAEENEKAHRQKQRMGYAGAQSGGGAPSPSKERGGKRRRAMTMYSRAAEQGHPDAQRTLGALLWEDGERETARHWLAEAAKQGAASEYWLIPEESPQISPEEAADLAARRAADLVALKATEAETDEAMQQAARRASARQHAANAVYGGLDQRRAAAAEATAADARAAKRASEHARQEAARAEAIRERHVSPYAKQMADAKRLAEAKREAETRASGVRSSADPSPPSASASGAMKKQPQGRESQQSDASKEAMVGVEVRPSAQEEGSLQPSVDNQAATGAVSAVGTSGADSTSSSSCEIAPIATGTTI